MDAETAAGAKDLVTKKVGPLPLVAWVVLGAGGVFVWRRMHRGSGTSAAAAPQAGAPVVGAPQTAAGMYGDMSGGSSDAQNAQGTLTSQLVDSITQLNSRLSAEQNAGQGPNMTANPILGDPSSIVSRQYATELGRMPDAGGMAYWSSYLTQHGLAAEQAAFNSAPETIINRDYWSYLGRAPEGGNAQGTDRPAIVSFWEKQLAAHGNDLAWLNDQFLNSPEHATYVQTHPDGAPVPTQYFGNNGPRPVPPTITPQPAPPTNSPGSGGVPTYHQ